MKCLRVNVDGSIDTLDYDMEDFLQCRLKNLVINEGGGEFLLLEHIDKDDRRWICYGYELCEFVNNVGFNRFEFPYSNPIGDVIIVLMEDGTLVDAIYEEFISLYASEDNLEEYLIQDELTTPEDSYEYGSWCVRSDDEN